MRPNERPILFSGPMVKAIIDGKKTQTRRIVKGAEGHFLGFVKRPLRANSGTEMLRAWFQGGEITCPYGQPGDRLWVRETWARAWELDDEGYPASEEITYYRADGEPFSQYEMPDGSVRDGIPWKPSIHMRRSFSRIDLQVTGIRVERLQDISEEDALTEGIVEDRVIVGANCNGGVHCEEWATRFFFDGCEEAGYESAGEAYFQLWASINGSPDTNSWVWVVEFRRLEGDKTGSE